MKTMSRILGFLSVVLIAGLAARCLADESQAANRTVVEHVRVKPKASEGELGTSLYAASKTESPFFKRLDESEKTTGGHDDEHDISKKAGKYVGWFGIVRAIVEDQAKQQTVLTVEHKYFDGLTDSHIMAVSFNGSGDFHAIVEGIGHQFAPLSLVRVYGKVAEPKGQQLSRLEAVFVRDWHWETFTFISAYGIQHGNENWRKLNRIQLNDIYDSNPDIEYYRRRLGDRPEDIAREKALRQRLLQAAIAVRPDAKKTFEVFIDGIRDVDSFQKQHEALDAIFKARDFDALTALLIQALKENDPRFRTRVIMIICDDVGELAAATIPALITAVGDQDQYVRYYSVRALGKFGPPAVAALPTLIAATKDADHYVRANAIEALVELELPPDQILPTLVAALKDTDSYVRFTTISKLEELGPAAATAVPELIELLQHDEDVKVRWNAAEAIGRIDADGKLGIPALTNALKSSFPLVRRFAAMGLAAKGPKAVSAQPILQQLLNDSDSGARVAAAEAVWKIGRDSKEALPVLNQVLEKGDGFGPMWAAEVIGEMGSEARDTIPGLRKMLKVDHSHFQQTAAQSLGKMGSLASDAVPDLVELFGDKHDALRAAAAEALWNINRHPLAIPQLLKEISGDSWDKHYAVAAIGRIGEPAAAAIPLLKELRYNRHRSVRKAANLVLKKLDPMAKP